MSGYFIVQMTVTNSEPYEGYKKLAKPIVEKYGGEYLVRGGKNENVEGNWVHQRTVVIKFPTYEMVKNWYNSEEYKPVKKIREKNTVGNAIIIEGY